MNNEIPLEIWKRRAELLRKAKDGKIDFREFNLLTMHKETEDLLAKDKPTLSEKGFATLNAIEMYIESQEVKQEAMQSEARHSSTSINNGLS